ncbi:hypothetical protein WME89_50585 [Sorangium sp. So ce321]|uniref:hypothetical protein n=1 Tax=Sorangium sp. So ce321 TaxID=3133300 RepID=UPI003F62D770
MNVTSKLDLDGMLNDWPAPALDEAAWETRAARIVEVALSRRSEARRSEARRSEDTAAQAALLAAPDLAAEPGEEQAGDILREVHAAGEGSTMADGSQADRAAKSEASLSGGSASRPPERKRQSLKEIAERASQAPGRLSGAPGASGSAIATPLPSGRGPLSTPLPPSGRGSMPPGRVSTPPGRGSLSGSTRASSPSLRTGDGVTEDSGVIDLNRLSASVPPEQVEAAGGVQPGAAESLEDEKPAEVAALSARRPRAVAAPAAEAAAKKRSGGMIAGVAIAALGLAAAVAVMVKTPKAPSQQETAAAPAAAPAPAAPRDDRPAEPAAPVAAVPAAPAVSAEAEQQPVEAEKLAAAPRTAAAPTGAGAPAPAAPEAPAAQKAEPQGKVAAAPTAPGKPGDLPSAMQAAVGDEAEKQPSVVSEAPVPASGPLRAQNIPEQPSQGSVQAALGSVMGNARACVAGADDVSRAQITFSSTGQVSKVSVSGWAAANGQSSCVQSALKAANVGPFSKPSFSINASIRP